MDESHPPEEAWPLASRFVFMQLKKHREKTEERFKLLEDSVNSLRKRLDKAGAVCKELKEQLSKYESEDTDA